jgi:radical SAM protein with 4Fe4S-binding SPASM domain
MKAIDITSQPPGGTRTPISQLVPLKTPLVVSIFPVYACNFKCKYCTFSINKVDRGFISDVVYMPMPLFIKCIDDLTAFPEKIKVLRFVGMGEPLLHKKLSTMISYAHRSNMFERIEMLTNGALLTKDMSDKLAISGLTRLLISIQGTSADKYLSVSNIKINFQNFLDNIKYFYNNRQKVHIHIKIIDCALDDENDKQLFFDLFGDMCDTIGVECAGPIYPNVEFNKELKSKPGIKNQYGAPATNLDICTQPFYFMQINPDGNVVPCHSIAYPQIMGNCYSSSLYDIWNNNEYNKFRYDMLDGVNNMCEECKQCGIFRHRVYDFDDLTNKVDELKIFYKRWEM